MRTFKFRPNLKQEGSILGCTFNKFRYLVIAWKVRITKKKCFEKRKGYER